MSNRLIVNQFGRLFYKAQFKVPQKQLVGECRFDPVTAEDLIDGIGTLSGRYGQGVIIPPPATGLMVHCRGRFKM